MSLVPQRLCGSMDGRTLKKNKSEIPLDARAIDTVIHPSMYIQSTLCDGLGSNVQQQMNERGQDEEEELHSAKFVFRRQRQLEPAKARATRHWIE